jgi:tetratricopeptide (TPR) repeat protein
MRGRGCGAWVVVIAGLVSLPACAAARAPRPDASGLHGGDLVSAFLVGHRAPAPEDPVGRPPPRPASDGLGTYVARVRALSATASARVPARPLAIETADPDLRAALSALEPRPGPAAHRAVSAAYLRLGVHDLAHDHATAAIALDPHDAASYDARARVWRAWGWPHLGLADAHRAVYFLPASAAARNTLGTILQALGHHAEARAAYRDALRLAPTAAWAMSNLCAVEIADGRRAEAAPICEAALRLDPSLLAARRNLVMARAGVPGARDLARGAGSQPGPSPPPR